MIRDYSAIKEKQINSEHVHTMSVGTSVRLLSLDERKIMKLNYQNHKGGKFYLRVYVHMIYH
jgi:hypothetical protein